MGNCQAAEAATVVIEHPGNKIQRIYWSVSVDQIMKSNPGHYVALVISSPNATPLKQLKLLRPHHTLHIGHVYRLITFQDVMNQFATKRCAKLGKLLKEIQTKHKHSLRPNPSTDKVEQEVNKMGSYGGESKNNKGSGRHFGGQWRPALQSISEIGT
uniref:Uncharacterized protein n=2 Tax=Cajanus cajan TaxID=3821 RepID=A0A151SC94_CAJCA|nr:hypothetical protein KK1_025674 [Cajanus cajan]